MNAEDNMSMRENRNAVDPRVALLGYLCVLSAASVSLSLTISVVLLAATAALVAFAASIRRVVQITVSLSFFAVVVFLLDSILVPGGPLVGVLMVLRLFAIAFATQWFVSAVTPDDLAQALHSLRVPYSLAWQIGAVYRFLPFFSHEATRVRDAQIARGIPLDGNLLNKVRSLPSLIVPIVAGTRYRSIVLSEILVARGWNPKSRTRTYLFPLTAQRKDFIALFLSTGFLLLSFLVTLVKLSVPFPPQVLWI